MNWEISIAYPYWTILLCLMVGAAYAYILYRSAIRNREDELNRLSKMLAAVRFVVVSVIALLILGPLITYIGFSKQRPLVTLLVDNSRSMVAIDSATNILNSIKGLEQDLADDYDIEMVLLGEDVRTGTIDDVDFTDVRSDVARGLDRVGRNASDRHVATILWSDGIVNQGAPVMNRGDLMRDPVFAIGVGDTQSVVDIRVASVEYNEIAYHGNDWPLRIGLDAWGMNNESVQLEVRFNGEAVCSSTWNIDAIDDYLELEMALPADQLGRNRIDVVVSTSIAERNKVNNKKTFFVEVIESRKRIEIWGGAPHPDMGAIKAMISSSDQYEVSVKHDNFKVDADASLVVLHHWFRNEIELSLFQALKAQNVATCVILGERSRPQYFNSNMSQITWSRRGSAMVSALPKVNTQFDYFTLSDDQKGQMEVWPPLDVPFGEIQGFKRSDILMYQVIGRVQTDEPLFAVRSTADGYRMGLIAGTGLWQWRMQDFNLSNGHQNIKSLMVSMVQFLGVKRDRRLLRVRSTQDEFYQNEEVTLSGELFNRSMQPVGGEEVNVTLIDEENRSYPHIMEYNGINYRLRLNGLKEGGYQYKASAELGGERLTDGGFFSVVGQNIEMLDVKADHQSIRELATMTGGVFAPLSDQENITSALQDLDRQQTIIEHEQVIDLVDLEWVFVLLVSLLAGEWFIRKYAGRI